MPLDPNRPSAQADLNTRFNERVASLEAGGTLAADLTAPAPTVDSANVAPAVAAPSAALPADAPGCGMSAMPRGRVVDCKLEGAEGAGMFGVGTTEGIVVGGRLIP